MSLNPANLITIGRILLVPVLLIFAWRGNEHLFLAGYVVSLVSDIADGQIARRFHLTSALGARLDSWADFATYFSLPLAIYWLRPDLFVSERWVFLTAIGCYLLPVAIGFLKFRHLTSYHTTLARISAYLIGASLMVIFARGPVWPFRLAVGSLMLAGAEEIGITLVLAAPRSNVGSLRKALAVRRGKGAQPS